MNPSNQAAGHFDNKRLTPSNLVKEFWTMFRYGLVGLMNTGVFALFAPSFEFQCTRRWRKIFGYRTNVTPSCLILIRIVWEAKFFEPFENLILGYFLRNSLRQQIPGDNTCWAFESPKMVPDVHRFEIESTWPSLAPQGYTLTLGIVQGLDPFEHEVSCWAHSIFTFWPERISPVHGILANPIIRFNVC